MVPNFTRILPHPLFLLLNAGLEPDIFTFANKQTLIVPQNEYVKLWEDLKGINGLYNILKYNTAKLN